MKIIKAIFPAFCLTLFNVFNVLADPPSPGPISPPDGPIDQNLMFLAAVAVLFGIYTIYKYRNTKKASV